MNGVKDLWCSSTVQLAAINTDMNGVGVKDLWCSSTVLLLSTQTLVNVKAPSILG